MADRLGDALGGQRIELFARCPRPGWESWGAEAEAMKSHYPLAALGNLHRPKPQAI